MRLWHMNVYDEHFYINKRFFNGKLTLASSFIVVHIFFALDVIASGSGFDLNDFFFPTFVPR